jgi:hypothetical protein
MIDNQTSLVFGAGYVKLYRTIKDDGWYKRPGYFHLFCHILMNATHSGYETWFNGRVVKLKPGQLVTGRDKLEEQTGIDSSSIQRILSFFTKHRLIEQQTTNSSRLITITNWTQFQRPEQQLNDNRTSAEQQSNTIQECTKNEKKYLLPELNISFSQFWTAYDKKVGCKEKLQKKWAGLSDCERQEIIEYLPKYKRVTPDKKFRKDPNTFLNNRSWEDEIVVDGRTKAILEFEERRARFKYDPNDPKNQW